MNIFQRLRCFTMLSPNITTDFSFLGSLFFFIFFLCWVPFPILLILMTISSFHGQVRFSVAAFILSVSLTIMDVSKKSSSWAIFCCTYLWLESREQWTLSEVSWLLTLLHSTTVLRFANYCSKEWITSLYILIALFET